jgi:acetyl-CoA carboxylase biotin carboxyl carrier protein
MKRTKKPAPLAAPKPQLPPPSRPDEPDAIDLGTVRALATVLDEFGLSELRWSAGKQKVVLRRGGVSAPAPAFVPHAPPPSPVVASGPAPTPVAAAPSGGQVVTSPFVGTFYRSPSPESPSFTEVGARVKKGQTLCIVEAMKLMNEIESEVDGTVVACLVENAQPVEFGQPLFRLQVG